MTALDILTRAKAELLRVGWCQHESTAKDGRRCGISAIDFGVAGSKDSVDDIAHIEAIRLFRVANQLPVYCGIAEWNDVYGRTFDEVLEAFDRAIALACEPEGLDVFPREEVMA
jgi:hypothetical protein